MEKDMRDLEEERPEELDQMEPEPPAGSDETLAADVPSPGVGDAFRGGS